ncbi:MAG: response regulator [Cyanobacteria bacterium P01_H01_bin.74]
MEKPTIAVLLIEDDWDDVEIIRILLAEAQSVQFSLTAVGTYDEGKVLATNDEFDVYLVDYRLGSKNGLDFIKEFSNAPISKPAILLTGDTQESLDIDALNAGATDYLKKGDFNSAILEKTIRYALERKNYQGALQDANRNLQVLKQLERELQSLSHFSSSGAKLPVSERMMGAASLNESHPSSFNAIVDNFKRLIEKALKAQMFKDHSSTVSTDLHKMANQLGFLMATPKDVIDCYSLAIKSMCEDASTKRSQIIIEEGRILLVQLMGYLCSYYRLFASPKHASAEPF